jgi:ribosomal protein S4
MDLWEAIKHLIGGSSGYRELVIKCEAFKVNGVVVTDRNFAISAGDVIEVDETWREYEWNSYTVTQKEIDAYLKKQLNWVAKEIKEYQKELNGY